MAHAWIACASAGCWPPPMLADDDDPRDCAVCGRSFACPLDWIEDQDSQWRVALRCGQCGHRRTVVLPETEAARLRERLASDAEAIAEEACALRRGLINAGDFAPRSR